MKRNIIIEIICGLLAILFVYAAISKLLNYDTFRLQLSQSPFVVQFANIVAWGIPGIEILVGGLLAVPALRSFGLYAALFLLSLFTAYLVAILNFSYYIPCSCGGILASLSWKQHILLNTVFIILSIAGILLTYIANECKQIYTL
jgi:uncharacterized membrane protein YphA (DoxX/SURF4 family)